MTELVCDIIIPIWNQPELTAACLRSLAACTPEPVRLILVDNGSDAPTRELLERETKLEFELALSIRKDPYVLLGTVTSEHVRPGQHEYGVAFTDVTLEKGEEIDELVRFLNTTDE